MKILVLFRLPVWKPQRKAIEDHLRCFERYCEEAEVFTCNMMLGLPRYLQRMEFDAILLHSTLVDRDVRREPWKSHLLKQLAPIKKMSGVKIAFPQDEWENTHTLWQFFKAAGVTSLFTLVAPPMYRLLYPEKESGIVHLETTFPGFVDQNFVKKVGLLSSQNPERSIDIGYRARHMGFLCGRLGLLKTALTDQFLSFQGHYGLKIEASNRREDVFYGDDWIRFLLRCRVMLGCPGGSSLPDFDGAIRREVESYLARHPSASFDEVEAHCFPGKEGKTILSMISPRHFECAITRTCQVLVEGDYSGMEMFKPGIHYIGLKPDFSNCDEVLRQVADRGYCEQIAAQAYEDLVSSDLFTYQTFIRKVLAHVRAEQTAPAVSQPLREKIAAQLLQARQKYPQIERLRWRLWYLRCISLPARIIRLEK